VNPATGQAGCQASLPAGSHALVADYSGDPYFGASASAPLTEVITALAPTPAARPRLSALSLGSHRFRARTGTTLRLTLSEAATLRIQVSRVLSGRRVRGRCETGVKHGTRCTISHRARRLQFRARKGTNRLRLKLKGLTPGSYVATIVARDAGGRASRTVTVRFVIVVPRR
jgi:hypothetical protein